MTTRNVKRNMNFQIDYCKEVLELLDTCEDKGITGDLTAEDLNHLRNHCENIMRASDIAIKLADLLDATKKNEKKAKEEKKKEPEEKPSEEDNDDDFSFDD